MGVISRPARTNGADEGDASSQLQHDGQRSRGWQTSTRIWILVAALAGGVLGAASVADAVGERAAVSSPSQWVLLSVALLIAGCLTVEIRHDGEIDSVDVFEAALTPAVFFLPGLGLVLLVAAAKTVAQLWLRMPFTKLAFNVAQWIACAGWASLIFSVLARSSSGLEAQLLALVAAMVAVAIVNLAALVALFTQLVGRSGARGLLMPPALVWTAGLTAATIATGIAVTAAASDHPAALLFIVGLPPLLHWAGRGYALAGADLDRLRAVQSATRALWSILDPREDATPFLAEVALCCSAQAAQLTMLRGGALETHSFTSSPRSGETELRDQEATLPDVLYAGQLPAFLVAYPRRRPRRRFLGATWPNNPVLPVRTNDAAAAAIRAVGWRDCLAVPVVLFGDRIGMLAVYNRSGLAYLDPAELVTLETLAREASAAIRRAQLIDEALDARENAARIVHASNDGIVALAEDGSVVTCNPAFETLTGQSAAQMVGAGGLSHLDAREADGMTVSFEDWTERGGLPDEIHIRTCIGQQRWLSCSYARTTRDGPTGPLLVVMVRDVTELRRQRDLIAMQRRVLELIAADDPPMRVLLVIAALVEEQMEGTAAVVLAEDATPPRFTVVLEKGGRSQQAPFDRGALLDRLRAVPHREWLMRAGDAVTLDVPGPMATSQSPDLIVASLGGPAIRPMAERAVNGDRRRDTLGHPQCWAIPVLDSAQANLQCVLVFYPTAPSEPYEHALEVLRTAARLAGICLERDAAHTQLAHQATHDPLTGLPNRLLFLDRCEHALDAGRSSRVFVAVLFVDLDRFKIVNDSLGHDAGDHLLVAVAQRLRTAVQPSDTIARFGGDEFTILCDALPAASNASILADRVLGLFAAPFHIQDREVFATASVGIALGRAPRQAKTLVRHADVAMYRAKAAGGNRREFFNARFEQRPQIRLADYTSLRRSVEAGEFEVHYQPTITLADGIPQGVEALARWRHPIRGLLSPAAFIDLAEETGLIVPLGTQILRTALREIPTMPPQGGSRPLRISVNLSARQLNHPDLTATVEQALADAGVAPERLLLEITETLLVTDLPAVRTAIAQLKEIGVGFSLDDFGTGHSSMDYLKFLPVDELKIERRFVGGLLTNYQDHAIVSAITRLAHDIGLRVVAEGVETAEQARHLRDIGCDIGQGFFFGRPMPANQVLDITRVFNE